jgi:hypothetical protein
MSLAYDYIKQIHAAKSEAHLDDAAYRRLLFRLTGETTSKALDNSQAKEVISEIKATAEHRDGWQVGQLKKFKQYQKYAGLNETAARGVLHEVTGVLHECSPELTQPHFEHVMAALEKLLADGIESGNLTAPKDIDIHYWRGRLPGNKATSRQLYEIDLTWDQLRGYLPGDKHTTTYLNGIIAQASRTKPGAALSVFTAKLAIDALKQKLEYEKNKLAAEVPF